MMEENGELLLFAKIGLFFVFIIFHYVYFYILHRIYGAKLYDVKKSKGKLSFKTSKSQYQLDRKHKKLIFKDKKDKRWKILTFDQLNGIHVKKHTGTASIVEFFFGGFGLFDFFNKYRDRLHTYEIKLGVVSDHPDINMDVILLSLKQYEQREFFLGQLMHDFDIWVMKNLGFYTSIDDVYEKKVKQITQFFKACGLELNCEQINPPANNWDRTSSNRK
jgi:hypothetical protein